MSIQLKFKRSGREEEYLSDKVYNASRDTGTSDEVAREIMKEHELVKRRGKVSTDEIDSS
jgi:transcriptional repressor NrdR